MNFTLLFSILISQLPASFPAARVPVLMVLTTWTGGHGAACFRSWDHPPQMLNSPTIKPFPSRVSIYLCSKTPPQTLKKAVWRSLAPQPKWWILHDSSGRRVSKEWFQATIPMVWHLDVLPAFHLSLSFFKQIQKSRGNLGSVPKLKIPKRYEGHSKFLLSWPTYHL